jgi:L-fucose isomerase-like protein
MLGPDHGIPRETLNALDRMTAALYALVERHALTGLTVKCHFELSQTLGVAACLPLSVLADHLPVSCEGDLPLLVTQVLCHGLSGDPCGFADIYDIDRGHLVGATCGYMPASFCDGPLRASPWTEGYGLGFANSSPVREFDTTLARLQPRRDRFVLHQSDGRCVKMTGGWREIGCPPFASTAIRLASPLEPFIRNLQGPHYTLTGAAVSPELGMAARMLKIDVLKEEVN